MIDEFLRNFFYSGLIEFPISAVKVSLTLWLYTCCQSTKNIPKNKINKQIDAITLCHLLKTELLYMLDHCCRKSIVDSHLWYDLCNDPILALPLMAYRIYTLSFLTAIFGHKDIWNMSNMIWLYFHMLCCQWIIIEG